MSLLEAIVLGLVQGLTEFLPVSSSGHLVMGQALLDIQLPGVAFETTVHVATLLSVLLVFRKRLGSLVVGLVRGDRESWRYLGLLVLATIPAVIVGLGARVALEALFEAPHVAGIGLLVTGGFLWTARGAVARDPSSPPGAREAILMGLAQAFAIIPGISRSGATVVSGLWLGVEAEEAATFSFLMAIPAILGAAVLQLADLVADPSGAGAVPGGAVGAQGGLGGAPLLLGGLVAAVAGVLAIWTFVVMLRKKAFHRFAPYCWAVGLLFLGFLFFKG
ncbi:MAG: undecaprenyl-diphosphate phosphatase [Gemmatimonadetes bacterium]|nr:undecaprenyl-diphosphate phosphatase [Gemmatimonadota bacterium]